MGESRITEHPEWLEQLSGQTALVEGSHIEAAGTVEITDSSNQVTVHCDQECGFAGENLKVTVSVFAPGAYFRLTGSATADGKILLCGPDMSIERIERRKWPRARLDLPVTLCPVRGSDIDAVPGRTVDISVGGACIETLSPVDERKAHEVRVVISLADGARIECSCATIAVEETEDGWRYRLSFRDLDTVGASRLEALTAA